MPHLDEGARVENLMHLCECAPPICGVGEDNKNLLLIHEQNCPNEEGELLKKGLT